MNQLCKVCGEPAAGFHFGAFTCEGCKSFFGRTYNNISAIAGCKNNGDCVINKKNRTACKACRLRKCLLVGMSKSGSRYGRRSNWFKIHCLLQEQQSQPGSPGSTTSTANNNSLEQLTRLQQVQARQTYQDKTNPCIKSATLSPTLPTLHVGASHTTTAVANSSSMNLPHFLHAAKFLNGVERVNAAVVAAAASNQLQQQNQQQQHLMKSSDSRLSNTPSDSGASSAGDPTDDCTSSASTARHMVERNCSSAQHLDVNLDAADTAHERRRKEFLEIFRSHSEPLRSPFVPFGLNTLSTSMLACTPPTHILPAAIKEELKRVCESTEPAGISATASTTSTPLALQDEPIDLSFKSLQPSRERSQTPLNTSRKHSPEPDCNESLVQVLQKPAPLDLTLVRSQTLTG